MELQKENHAFINFESWYIRCKDQYEQNFVDNFSNFEKGLEVLSKKYNKILEEKELQNHTESWDFSIFDIVKVSRKEENIHSPLLANLLDPKGSHGQKDLFYKLFLYEIVGEEKAQRFLNNDHNEYVTISEEFIKNDLDKGEIDLTIKSTNRQNKFAVIIENKWASGDSCPDQLFKYYRNFTNPKGKAFTDENLLVIYLTKYGGNPSWVMNKDFELFLLKNIGVNYFPISYLHDVRNWLEKCVKECKSEKVKYLIEQYLNHIKL